MAVRRLIRAKGPNTVTLGKLLESMIQNSHLLTRDRYLERWHQRAGPEQLDRGRREYETEWDDGSGHLNVQRLRQDKGELNRIALGVLDFADRSVAHTVEGRPQIALTFGELDGAIDHVADTYQRYAILVTGTYYGLLPVVVDDWQSSFYRPLFDAPAWWPRKPAE